MEWWWIVLGVGFFIFNLWIIWDAFDHTGYGCAWLAAFLFVPGISHVVYLFIRYYVNRPDINPGLQAGGIAQQEFSRFPTEIEKARFIEAADREFGTMYEPGSNAASVGYPHFRDERADLLLSEGRLDEAWDYLIDLYDLAKSDGDGHREDTYLHYISRLPEGLEMLYKWRGEQRLERGGGNDDPPPPTPPISRDVPF